MAKLRTEEKGGPVLFYGNITDLSWTINEDGEEMYRGTMTEEQILAAAFEIEVNREIKERLENGESL
tara:strand:- start:2345 stop:2545 length:201 start_codon:yes stop_codon:yes gene_type:complete